MKLATHTNLKMLQINEKQQHMHNAIMSHCLQLSRYCKNRITSPTDKMAGALSG